MDKTSDKKSEVTRNENKEMLFFSVFIDLRASSKLALRGDHKVNTLDVHRHLIFMAFFRHELLRHLLALGSCL